MFKKPLQIAALAAIAVVSGCATDVDLTGEYAETAVVYGLLDESNNPANGGSGHLIRIQKAFLGDASAVDMALVSDSSYFPYEDLEVTLLEIIDTLGTWDTVFHVLDTAMVNTKQTTNGSSVDFFGPQQRVYRANINFKNERSQTFNPPSPAVSKRKYGLVVRNTASGYTANSFINPLNMNRFKWKIPQEPNPIVSPLSFPTFYNLGNNDYQTYSVSIELAGNSDAYETWLRFHYREVVGTDTVKKSLMWKVKTFNQPTELGGDVYPIAIDGKSVFSFIGSNISPEPNKQYLLGHRYNSLANGAGSGVGPVAFDIVIKVAGPELSALLDLTGPGQTSVVTEVPVYSNISNGIGVFSSRGIKEFKDMYIKLDQVEEYKSGQFTGHIGFRTDQ